MILTYAVQRARDHPQPRQGHAPTQDAARRARDPHRRRVPRPARRDHRRYKPLVWLLAATGLRWGEATALQWRDISGTQITVRQAWKHATESHKRILGPPKTQKGRRRVETTKAVIDSLGDRGERQRLRVHQRPSANPSSYNRFYLSHWVRACTAAKLDPVPNIHGLRHFAASHMLAQGTDIFEVSRALGHGDIGITTGVYGHLVPSKTRPTAVHAARLDELRAKQLEA